MILNSPYISGSLTVTGNIISSGSITISGSIASSSYATNADRLDNLDSTSFVFTSSYNTDSASVSTRVTKIEGNYATTGSNVFMGAQTVCANITSTGTIVAQTLNVQQVTSSIVYSSGSNIFGCLPSDVQQMTGSLRVTGSGNHFIVGGNFGVGTSSPNTKFEIGEEASPILRITSTSGPYSQIQSNTVGTLQLMADEGNTGANTSMRFRIDGFEAMRFTSSGSACFACQTCAPGMDIMPSGIGVSTLGGIMRVVTTGTSTGIAVGQSNSNRYTHFAANDIQVFNDDFFLTTRCAFPLSIGTCYTARLTFAATGIACFSCRVCTPVITITGCSTSTIFEGYNQNTDDGNGLYIKAGGVNSGKYVMALENAAGCSRMIVLANGNVGIGTTSVPFGLTVYRPSTSQGDTSTNLLLFDTTGYGTGVGGGISFGGYYNNTNSEIYTYGYVKGGKENSTNDNFAGYVSFGTRASASGASAERMRITSGGNVQISSDASYGSGGGQLQINKDASSTPPTLTLFGWNNLSVDQAAGVINFSVQTTGTAGQVASSIRGLNADIGESSGHLAFYTTSNTATPAGSAGTERMRITCNGVVRIGACAINLNTNSNVALQVAGAIRFGNPDGEYSQSYGGGISARSCTGWSPGVTQILVKGLGDAGFLYQIQGFTGAGAKFTDIVFGIASTVCILGSANVNTPASRCYTITSENLNLCLSGAASYNVVAAGFGAVER